MFSWVKGVKIARVNSGQYHNKFIRYSADIDKTAKIKVSDPVNYITEKWLKDHSRKKRLTGIDLNKIYTCLVSNRPPEDDDLFDLYQQCLDYISDQSSNEITIDDGKIVLIPPPIYKLQEGELPETSRIYVAGPTGSGKSHWCAEYIKEVIKQRKYKNIYIFSNLSEDPILDKISPTPKRIAINENLIDPPILLNEMKDSIILFDDIDAIKDDKVRKSVQKLRDEANCEGRHYSIFALSTGHQLLNYKLTRNILADCNYITFFPRSGGDYWINQFLKNYCGCSKVEIEKIMNLPSRWVCIKKTYPMMCFYDKGLFLMGDQPKSLKQKPKEVVKQKQKQKEIEYDSQDNSFTYDNESEIRSEIGSDNESDYSSED